MKGIRSRQIRTLLPTNRPGKRMCNDQRQLLWSPMSLSMYRRSCKEVKNIRSHQFGSCSQRILPRIYRSNETPRQRTCRRSHMDMMHTHSRRYRKGRQPIHWRKCRTIARHKQHPSIYLPHKLLRSCMVMIRIQQSACSPYRRHLTRIQHGTHIRGAVIYQV